MPDSREAPPGVPFVGCRYAEARTLATAVAAAMEIGGAMQVLIAHSTYIFRLVQYAKFQLTEVNRLGAGTSPFEAMLNRMLTMQVEISVNRKRTVTSQ